MTDPSQWSEREEEVECFFDNKRLWPDSVWASRSTHPCALAIREVLVRLPETEWEFVENCVSFLVDDSRIIGQNVPLPVYPGTFPDTSANPPEDLDELFPHLPRAIPKLSELVPTGFSINPPGIVHTIFISRWARSLSERALVGLVAHEIGHCFVNEMDGNVDEAMTDAKAREWGF